MCGITGIVDLRERRPIDEERVRAMNAAISHRGPDGDGFHFEPGVGFGHRRLSIIDLEGGRQPLYNEDETVVVTYNGEIFNFQEVEAELLARGHRFRTRCDTEVIVHAWEEWGEQCLQRFNGMFAFAVWGAVGAGSGRRRSPRSSLAAAPAGSPCGKRAHFVNAAQPSPWVTREAVDSTRPAMAALVNQIGPLRKKKNPCDSADSVPSAPHAPTFPLSER